MSRQAAPSASQRCHWYVKSSGRLPSHSPSPAVSVSPKPTLPETIGGLVETGGSAATGPTAGEATVVCSPLSPVTRTITVEPMSSLPSV